MVFKNALFTVGVRITLLAAGLATTIITARWLGPGGRGDYFFVVALAAIASQIVHLGLHTSNAYCVAKEPRIFGQLAVNSYWVSVVLGIAAAAVAIAASMHFGHHAQQFNTLGWLLLLTPSTLAALYISNLFVGAGRISEYNLIQLAVGLLPFVFICGIALFERNASAFLGAAATAAAVFQILLGAYALRGTASGWRFDGTLFRAGMPLAIRVYVVNALTTLTLKAPALMFSAPELHNELGFFSVASQVFDAVSIVPASIAAVLFPVLMKLEVDRWRETCRYMAVLMGLALAAAVAAAALAPLLVTALFGSKFLGAILPLQVILPAAVFVSGTSILSQYLATHGMPRSTAIAWLVAGAVCGGIGPMLIKNYGAVGAALVLSLVTGIAWLILLALSFRAARRWTDASPMETANAS